MKKVLFGVLLILTFLSAAKSHGRQYRLERELNGYWIVSFRIRNDPWVEKFWLQQRVLYWSVASLTAIVLSARRVAFRKSGRMVWFLLLLVPVSMIVAFVVMGVISAARLALHLGGGEYAPSQQWLQAAIWGSLGWWILTAGLILTLVTLQKKSIGKAKPR